MTGVQQYSLFKSQKRTKHGLPGQDTVIIKLFETSSYGLKVQERVDQPRQCNLSFRISTYITSSVRHAFGPCPSSFSIRSSLSHSHVSSLPVGFPRSDRGDACILIGGRVVRVFAFLTRPSWMALGEFRITVG